MHRNKGGLVALVLSALVAVLLIIGLRVYTDLAWFDSLGLASVLWKRIWSEWLLFLSGWLIATAVLLANWRLAHRLGGGGTLTIPWLRPQHSQYRVTATATTRTLGSRVANGILAVGALVLGFLLAWPARAMWLTALMARHGVPFGRTDPVLGRDLGFTIYDWPWQRFLQGWFLWLVLMALGGAVLVYLVSYSAQRLTAKSQVVGTRRIHWHLQLPAGPGRHLLTLAAVALALVAWGYQLTIPTLLFSTAGAAFGAGYADLHARLPVLHILTGLAALGALILLSRLFFRRWARWLPYAVIGAWLLAAFVGGGVYPGVLQRLVVEPDELAREREYISRTIDMTRAAFGLDRITEADFAVSEETPSLDRTAHKSTIQNIRLWDYRPLMRTYSQLQEIRLYYSFHDVDIDRYRLDDQYRQVMLAAREIDQNELPDTAKTWVNRHLVYTHGIGVVLSPVTEVLAEGLPQLWVRDIPPEALFPELALTRPEIYFGELAKDYVIVRTKEQELDYPSGDSNVYTTYDGEGGVLLNSPLKRLGYALRLGHSQILLSNSITADSRLLWRRAVEERVQALAPFLHYDPDPYLVIANGRLAWLLDAYTATNRYPYSEPIDTAFGQLNYLRNSVKVSLDAYDGQVRFYLVDPEDPLAATYAAIFPDLFQPGEEMDPTLVAHWRYPEGMFSIQATKYQTFHMTDPQVFYNQEDLWSWAEEMVGGEQLRMEPYYVNMSLPGQEQNEFVLMLPFTPATKQNMIAWLYAHNDGESYGQLGVYKFPKQRLIYGPMQVESRIDQDPVISQQLSLWNQRGSQVIRGNSLVIPIDRAVLYVEPIYLQAEASQMPELRRVIVVYGNRIAMEETLDQALAKVISTGSASAPPPEPAATLPPLGTTAADLAIEANAHYQAGEECLRSGDWTCYGQEMEALAQILEALVAATRQQP